MGNYRYFAVALICACMAALTFGGKAIPEPTAVAPAVDGTNSSISDNSVMAWCCPLNCGSACWCPDWSTWCYTSGGRCYCAN